MGIVIVNEVKGGTPQDVERFAKETMNVWGVGKTACNNGMLEVIAVQNRHLYIATGKGAKEHIPDAELQTVIERMKPLLKNQQYDDAAEQSVSDIARILSGESLSTHWDKYGVYWCVGGFLVYMLLSSTYTSRMVAKYDRAKCVLKQIDFERAQANAERYQVLSCPICLDSFKQTLNLKTNLLPCGHTFHERCINSWMAKSDSCPICRQSTIPRPVSSDSRLYDATPQGYEEEYTFRIQRARVLYGEFITPSMANRWICGGTKFHGELAADTDFITRSPNYNTRSSGSSSSLSSSSFGGGDSGGGGGAGGSW